MNCKRKNQVLVLEQKQLTDYPNQIKEYSENELDKISEDLEKYSPTLTLLSMASDFSPRAILKLRNYLTQNIPELDQFKNKKIGMSN